MEGFIGEIRLFAGNFAPKNWAFCQGQIININQNTSLFSLLGTVYGGNGTTTFGLPNLQGRVVIGAGSGPGLTPRQAGDNGGQEQVTLLNAQMPAHTSNIGGALTLKVSSQAANSQTAAGASFGQSSVPNTQLFQYTNASPDITLNAGSVTVNIAGVSNGNVMGGGQPHENRQPLLALNYIICLQGTFPPRG